MAIPADFTVRARDEMFNIYVQYQALFRRIEDLNDEVTALGGAAGIYGADGSQCRQAHALTPPSTFRRPPLLRGTVADRRALFSPGRAGPSPR